MMDHLGGTRKQGPHTLRVAFAASLQAAAIHRETSVKTDSASNDGSSQGPASAVPVQ